MVPPHRVRSPAARSDGPALAGRRCAACAALHSSRRASSVPGECGGGGGEVGAGLIGLVRGGGICTIFAVIALMWRPICTLFAVIALGQKAVCMLFAVIALV